MNTLLGPPLVRETYVISLPCSQKLWISHPSRCQMSRLFLVVLAMVLGCEQPSAENHEAISTSSPEAPISQDSEVAEDNDYSALPAGAHLRNSQETWHANYLQGKKIGYRQTAVREFELDGKHFVQTDILEKQSLLRFGEKVTLVVRAGQLAKASGELVQIRYELPLGSEVSRVQGKISEGNLTYWSEGQPEKPPVQIPFPAETLGFSGLEESLAKQPMSVGEHRTLKMLQLPPLPLVGTVELEAKTEEPTPLPAGEVRLLRVDEKIELPGGSSILCHFWIDKTGQILKYSIPPVQQETFLVTRAQALDEREAFSVDLGSDMLVRLDKPLDNPHQKLLISYRVRFNKDQPEMHLQSLLSAGLSQRVSPINSSEALVEVSVVRPDFPEALPEKQPKPTAADIKPSSLVESDAAEIKALAQEALSQKNWLHQGFAPGSSWSAAEIIEKFVHGYLTQKNYSQAFSSAAEVARTREGDCTEHAVLVAALCRANGIPARVTYGLVYVASEQAFAFHMWNEVWINDRWVPIDATLALRGIGAGHIKFGHSNLSDLSALLELLPVMQSIGRLEIVAEKVEAQP